MPLMITCYRQLHKETLGCIMDPNENGVGYFADSGPRDGSPSLAESVFSSAAAVMNLDKRIVSRNTVASHHATH